MIILIGWTSALWAVEHFTPVTPTGLPYHIIVTSATVNGNAIPAGAEIGVFDGDLCVGSAIISTTGQTNIDIVAWQGNPSYNLPGFTVGHPITFKIWASVYGAPQELIASATFSTGDGTFGAGSYSSVVLSATSSLVPIVDVQPLSLDFGAVTVNRDSTLKFTLSNIGSARLKINGLSVSDWQYSLGQYPDYLEPDQTAEVSVTFRPQSATLIQGSITINTDDPVHPQKQVSLTGQGIPVQQALIQVNPTSLDFGYVPVGNSVTQTILIQNTGNQVLNVTNISSSNNRFVALESTFAIGIGATHALQVQFTPNNDGSVSSNLTISSNAGNSPNFSISLYGNGYTAHFTPVMATGLPYTIVINNATVDGHSLQTGDQLAVFDGALCVGTAVYRGSFPLQMTAWRGDAAQGLAGFTAGHSMTFKIWTTAYEQTIELTPSASYQQGSGIFGEGEFAVVSLSANSNLQPIINAYEKTLSFPPLTVGMQDTLTFTVANKGLSNLYVSNIISSDGSFRAIPTNFTLAPLTSREVMIIFQPASAMPFSANLTIYSNDPSTPTIAISLTGQGLPATARSIQVSTSTVTFPPTKIGATTTSTITLFNTGSAPLTVNSVQFSNARFSADVTNFEIPVGASYNLTVNFTPNAVGQFDGTITINNNSSNNPNVAIAASGVGYEGYFQPVEPTGMPYMVVVSAIASEPLISVQGGDEIGVFDGQLCVGSGVIENVSSAVTISCWKADDSRGLIGFTSGNPIKIRYFGRRAGKEYLYSCNHAEYFEGDGRFGTGVFSSLGIKVDHEIPGLPAPAGFTILNNIQTIDLGWESFPHQNITHIKIYRSQVSGFPISQETFIGELSGQATAFSDSNIVNGTNYYYAITVTDSINRTTDPVYLGPVLAVYVAVWDVTFDQRKDGSALVDIYYSFSGHFSTNYQVITYFSGDNGNTWTVLDSLEGATGAQLPGNDHHLVWNFGKEYPANYFDQAFLKIIIADFDTKTLTTPRSEFILDIRKGSQK